MYGVDTMANCFTSDRDPGAATVRMSNGATAVLFDTMAIAGCARARTDWERAAMQWLIERDQARIGLGMAGFDVRQLGWTAEAFGEQRAFLLAVLDDAASGVGWERLPFQPGEGVAALIRELRDLVARFTSAMIVEGDDPANVSVTALPEAGTCEVHGTYLHELGCIVCNDAPIDAAPELRPHSTAHP